MTHYRVYLIGGNGRFISALNLDCANDEAAIESAKQIVDGHDVELWQEDRKIVRLDHTEN